MFVWVLSCFLPQYQGIQIGDWFNWKLSKGVNGPLSVYVAHVIFRRPVQGIGWDWLQLPLPPSGKDNCYGWVDGWMDGCENSAWTGVRVRTKKLRPREVCRQVVRNEFWCWGTFLCFRVQILSLLRLEENEIKTIEQGRALQASAGWIWSGMAQWSWSQTMRRCWQTRQDKTGYK